MSLVDFTFTGGPEFRKQYDDLPSGRTIVGSAFTLTGEHLSNCHHVIVAIVPSTEDNGAILLPSVLSNSLQCADRVKTETVALPVLGRNFSGFDDDQHCQLLVDALVKYFQENSSSCIKNVKLVELSQFAFRAFEKALKNHKDIHVSKLQQSGEQSILSFSGIAKAFLGGGLIHLDNQNEDKN